MPHRYLVMGVASYLWITLLVLLAMYFLSTEREVKMQPSLSLCTIQASYLFISYSPYSALVEEGANVAM